MLLEMLGNFLPGHPLHLRQGLILDYSRKAEAPSIIILRICTEEAGFMTLLG